MHRRIANVVLVLIAGALSAMAQSVQANEFGGIFAAYQASASPAITGGGLYARQLAPVAAPKTYSMTEYDVIPRTWRPFVMSSVVRTGLYQELPAWGPLTYGLCFDVGGGEAGSNAVGSFAGCGAAYFRIGKTKWHVAAMVSGVKTSLADTTTIFKFGIRRDR